MVYPFLAMTWRNYHQVHFLTMRLLITLATFFVSDSVFGQPNNVGLPFSTYFSSQEYRGGIQNWTITQGQEGMIYVANNFGLLEYDGRLWQRYAMNLGVKCRDVYVHQDGLIYAAGQGDFGYFSPEPNGQLQYRSLADSLPAALRNLDETWRVFKADTQFYFCTFDKVLVFDAQHRFSHAVSLAHRPERFHLVNDQLYVDQPVVGLAKLEGHTFVPVAQTTFLADKTVTGILPLEKNKWLITTAYHGAFVMDAFGINPWNLQYQDTLRRASINTAIRLQNGDVAFGTQNAGAYIFSNQGQPKLHLNKGKGIESRTVLSMYQDRHLNLWLGHNNGISLLELAVPFAHLNEQSGLPGTGYAAFVFQDDLYLGTNNGLYVRRSSAESQRLELVKNSEGQVYSLCQVGDELLMGHHLGSFRIGPRGAEKIANIPGTWTFLDLASHPKFVLQGHYNGLALFEKTPTGLAFRHPIAGFEESSRVMCEDNQDGGIWMTHGYKGVFKLFLSDDLKQATAKFFSEESGLPSKRLISVYKLGTQLLFPTEQGVYLFNHARHVFEPYRVFDNHIGSHTALVSLEEDVMGNLFYVSLDQIGMLKKDGEGRYTHKSNVFNRLRLLLNDDLQYLMSPAANQMLFAAKEGFIFYDDHNLYDPQSDFHTLIRKVSVGGMQDTVISYGRYYQDGQLSFQQRSESQFELSAKQNNIAFEFASLFIPNLDATHYQFYLENLEDNFSEWTAKNTKEYTNLREGNYTFRVRARNVYHHIGQEASFSFSVLPPWYRTQCAYVLYGLCGLLLGVLIYWTIEERYRRKAVRITRVKEQEITQKEGELKNSEREVERLKNEKLKAEIASKNKELATSTMHLINKNSFINSVKSHLITILKNRNNELVSSDIKRIIKDIDKHISVDDTWEHFAVHFDQVHGDFARRLREAYPDLTPQEMKLSAYLRLNLSTKEIADLLSISTRGVEIARYRLRKKLGLERAVNLQDFILRY